MRLVSLEPEFFPAASGLNVPYPECVPAADLTHYFIHYRDGEFIEDPDGSNLPDLEAARIYAIESARELWVNAIKTGRDLSDAFFEITDSTGERLAVVPLVEGLPQGLRERMRA